MKRFIVCIWFGLVFSFLYGAAVSFDDMRERIAYDPLGSLASLDSLETDSTYFSYQIDYLRALSYQSQSQYYSIMSGVRLRQMACRGIRYCFLMRICCGPSRPSCPFS